MIETRPRGRLMMICEQYRHCCTFLSVEAVADEEKLKFFQDVTELHHLLSGAYIILRRLRKGDPYEIFGALALNQEKAICGCVWRMLWKQSLVGERC